jgi:hypothetical protein
MAAMCIHTNGCVHAPMVIVISACTTIITIAIGINISVWHMFISSSNTDSFHHNARCITERSPS